MPAPAQPTAQTPEAAPTDLNEAVERLVEALRDRRFATLTGAGCSTESGIPDYRGGGRTGPKNPIYHDAFVRRPEVRRRYWARATLGWVRFAGAAPNAAHRALADLERTGLVPGVVTQNVDGLHQRAGSRRVIELHGGLDEVHCLRCATVEPRAQVQQRLLDANPGWLARVVEARPDGDADLPPEAVAEFRVVGCVVCGGDLKPAVVFFGGTVPQTTVTAARALVDGADALLVVGSSLAVLSGLRFVRWARERGVPVCLVNVGPTRGDDLCDVKIDARAGDVLPCLATALGATPC